MSEEEKRLNVFELDEEGSRDKAPIDYYRVEPLKAPKEEKYIMRVVFALLLFFFFFVIGFIVLDDASKNGLKHTAGVINETVHELIK